MNLYAVAALSAALVASVLALAREMRLRRALARLLSILLSRWRPNETNRPVRKSVDSPLDRDRGL